jgi:hypothetical protein
VDHLTKTDPLATKKEKFSDTRRIGPNKSDSNLGHLEAKRFRSVLCIQVTSDNCVDAKSEN